MDRFHALSRDDRRKLLRLVCSFAWLDQEVQDAERAFITRLIEGMNLGEEDKRDAFFWLQDQVTADEVATAAHDVPEEHRMLFVEVARGLIASDDTVTDDEAQELALLELLAG